MTGCSQGARPRAVTFSMTKNFRAQRALYALLAALILAMSLAAGAGASSGAGDFGPPATKNQCLRILKRERSDLGAERKAFPARKKAATAKINARRAAADALNARYDAIQPQIDAIMNTNTAGLTQQDVDAMNARIGQLTAQQRGLHDKVDTAEGKTEEAVLARQELVKKYNDDMKNWPVQIEQIKRYCANM